MVTFFLRESEHFLSLCSSLFFNRFSFFWGKRCYRLLLLALRTRPKFQFFKKIFKEKIDFWSSGRDLRSQIRRKINFFKRILKEKIDFWSSGRDPRSQIPPKIQILKGFLKSEFLRSFVRSVVRLSLKIVSWRRPGKNAWPQQIFWTSSRNFCWVGGVTDFKSGFLKCLRFF